LRIEELKGRFDGEIYQKGWLSWGNGFSSSKFPSSWIKIGCGSLLSDLSEDCGWLAAKQKPRALSPDSEGLSCGTTCEMRTDKLNLDYACFHPVNVRPYQRPPGIGLQVPRWRIKVFLACAQLRQQGVDDAAVVSVGRIIQVLFFHQSSILHTRYNARLARQPLLTQSIGSAVGAIDF
jgi:hypothetical protein